MFYPLGFYVKLLVLLAFAIELLKVRDVNDLSINCRWAIKMP